MSGQTLADQKGLIKDSLLSFIQRRTPTAQLSVDEIVLNYCVSILEELGENQDHDEFDIEGFCEMMQAFVQEFATIPQAEVAAWMFELEASLREIRNQGVKFNSDDHKYELLSALLAPVAIDKTKQAPLASETSPPENAQSKRVHLLSETSDGSSDSSSSVDFPSVYDQALYILQELFPMASLSEIHHCVSVGDGDPGVAAQLLIDRQESGQSILTTTTAVIQAALRQKPVNDSELKTRIIEKYSYVDRNEDHREHHPIQPKSEPKKLVRYRDNKIVSLKGERFTEVKRDDMEEPKKPVVAVKPQRKNHNNH